MKKGFTNEGGTHNVIAKLFEKAVISFYCRDSGKCTPCNDQV